MTDVMLFQVVHLGLLVVAQIANAQHGLWFTARKRYVECEHVAQRGRRTDGRRHDVMIVVATREDFVVRLSVVGREHQACQGNAEFIA